MNQRVKTLSVMTNIQKKRASESDALCKYLEK
jgi:hypothetical protein